MKKLAMMAVMGLLAGCASFRGEIAARAAR